MDADALAAQMPSHVTPSAPSPAAVSDASALSEFLSEIQQLEVLELFQFEDEEQDGCTACYYSIQEGESAVKKRCVELEWPSHTLQVNASALHKKKLTSTQRRRLEIDRLRVTAEQLQHKLAQVERNKTEELKRRTDGAMNGNHGDEMWAHTATEVENGYLQEQIAGLHTLIHNVMSLLHQSTAYLQVRTRHGQPDNYHDSLVSLLIEPARRGSTIEAPC